MEIENIRSFSTLNEDGTGKLIFYKDLDSGDCFVQEQFEDDIIGDMNIIRQCNTRKCGDLDKYLIEKIPYILENKPIGLILPRWYEHRNIHTYLSYGRYSIGIRSHCKDGMLDLVFDTSYEIYNRTLKNKYTIMSENAMRRLGEVYL